MDREMKIERDEVREMKIERDEVREMNG